MSDPPTMRELGLLRLVSQALVGPRQGSPEQVVRELLCLQAQDYWSGIASVAVRGSTSLAAVEAALNAGAIVRAWPLRGTLHLVAAEDLGWLRDLLAPRELAAAAAREARLGIDARTLDKAERVIVEFVTAHGPARRTDLVAAWQHAGIETHSQRSYHLLWHLAHTGLVCFGPIEDGQQLVRLCAGLAARPTRLSRLEALEALARRFFEGHGPATDRDLARWANLTLADARQGIAAARANLASLTVDDTAYLLGQSTQDDLAACRREAAGVFALPMFDELIFGYRDRTPTVPADRDAAVFAHGNGVGACTVVLRGEVVATWKRPPKGRGGPVEITPLAAVPARALRLARQRAEALL